MTTQEIIEKTAAVFGLTADDLLSSKRDQHTAWARQAAMLLMSYLMPWIGCVEIGRIFRRDHTTVLYGLAAAKERGRTMPAYQQAVMTIKQALEA